jgi:hypothetical protein
MAATDLLMTLRGRGLILAADGDSLIVRPRELLTDELRAAIRTHKPEILAELAAANETPLDALADPGTGHRRAKALDLLAEHPTWRRVVLAEVGEPV